MLLRIEVPRTIQEVLDEGGVYFATESTEYITMVADQIITEAELCTSIVRRAKELAGQYSWKRCADETFAFIDETYLKTKT